MENTKQVGRPKGYKVTDETRAKISKGMKEYYTNMTPTQRRVRERCNEIKRIAYAKAIKEYYEFLENNLWENNQI